ncbi:MAG TPA: hypothetical protein PK402_14020, partial [Tepidisphaeraceae bacterium]|nr:hypothetical protein [Tepidisphaeraceae bacterium]
MVLGTLFSLASLYVTLRWMGLTKQTINALPPEANRLYMLMIVTVVIASLAHPIAGLVPVAALLISWWKRGTVESQQMSSLAPIALLGIAVMGLYLYMQSKILSSATLAELDFGTTPLAELFSRLQLAGYSLVFHALKLIVPYPLNFDYGRPPIGILMLASLVIVAGGVGLLFSQSQKIGRGALAALGLYALFLLPFLNIFNIERMRWSFIRDGEVYAAAIPLLALLVVLLIRALKSEKTALPIIGLVALVFAGLSLVRSGEFKDDATLWQKTIARNPNSLLAELETTKALIAKKDPAFKEHLNRALTINKKNLDAQTLEAVYATGEYLNQSIAMLSKLVNTYPTYAPATFATAQQ